MNHLGGMQRSLPVSSLGDDVEEVADWPESYSLA